MMASLAEDKIAGFTTAPSPGDGAHGMSGSPGATSSNLTLPRAGYSSGPALTSRASSSSVAGFAKEGSPREYTVTRYRSSPLPSPPTTIMAEQTSRGPASYGPTVSNAMMSQGDGFRLQEPRHLENLEQAVPPPPPPLLQQQQHPSKKSNYRPLVSSPALGREAATGVGFIAAPREADAATTEEAYAPAASMSVSATGTTMPAEPEAVRSTPVTLPPSALIMRQRDRIHSLVAEHHQQQMDYQDLLQNFERLKKDYEQHLVAEEARRADEKNRLEQQQASQAETLALRDAQIEELRTELSLSQKAAEEVIVDSQARWEDEQQKIIERFRREREELERVHAEELSGAVKEASAIRTNVEQELQAQLSTREEQWMQHSEGLQAQLRMLMEELHDALEERRILLEDRTHLRHQVEDREKALETAKQQFYHQELPKALCEAEKKMLEVVKGKEQALLLREEAFEVLRDQLEGSRLQWQQRSEKETVALEQCEFRVRALQDALKEKDNLVLDLRAELLQAQKESWRKENASGESESSLIKEHERRYEKLQSEYRQLQKQQLEESEATTQKLQRMQLQERQRAAEHTLSLEEASHRATRAENALQHSQRQLQEQADRYEKKEEEVQRLTLDLHRTRRDLESVQAKLYHVENDTRKVREEKDDLLRERQVLVQQLKHLKNKNTIQEKELSGYRTELWHLQAKLWSHGLRFASMTDPLAAIPPLQGGGGDPDGSPSFTAIQEGGNSGASGGSRTPNKYEGYAVHDGETEGGLYSSPPESQRITQSRVTRSMVVENNELEHQRQVSPHAGLVRSPPQSPTPTSREQKPKRSTSVPATGKDRWIGKKASGKKANDNKRRASHHSHRRSSMPPPEGTGVLAVSEKRQGSPQEAVDDTYVRSFSGSSSSSSDSAAATTSNGTPTSAGNASFDDYVIHANEGQEGGNAAAAMQRFRGQDSHKPPRHFSALPTQKRGREVLPPGPVPHLSQQFLRPHPSSHAEVKAAAAAGANGGSTFLSSVSSLTTPSGFSFLPQARRPHSPTATKAPTERPQGEGSFTRSKPHPTNRTSHRYEVGQARQKEESVRKGHQKLSPSSFLSMQMATRHGSHPSLATQKVESSRPTEDAAEVWFDDPLLSLGGSDVLPPPAHSHSQQPVFHHEAVPLSSSSRPPTDPPTHDSAVVLPGMRPLSIERSQENPIASSGPALHRAGDVVGTGSPPQTVTQPNSIVSPTPSATTSPYVPRLEEYEHAVMVRTVTACTPPPRAPAVAVAAPSSESPMAAATHTAGMCSSQSENGIETKPLMDRRSVGLTAAATAESPGVPTPRGGCPTAAVSEGGDPENRPCVPHEGGGAGGLEGASVHSASVCSASAVGGAGSGSFGMAHPHLQRSAASPHDRASTAAVTAAAAAATSLAAATISSSSGALQSLSNSLDVAMERYVAATSKLPFRPGASYEAPNDDLSEVTASEHVTGMIPHSTTVPLTLGELIQRQKETIQRASQPQSLPQQYQPHLRYRPNGEDLVVRRLSSSTNPAASAFHQVGQPVEVSRASSRVHPTRLSSREEREGFMRLNGDGDHNNAQEEEEEEEEEMEDGDWIIHKSTGRPPRSPPSGRGAMLAMGNAAEDEEEVASDGHHLPLHPANAISSPSQLVHLDDRSSFSSSYPAIPMHSSGPVGAGNSSTFANSSITRTALATPPAPQTTAAVTNDAQGNPSSPVHASSRLETLRESFLMPFKASAKVDAALSSQNANHY